jgi:hypothetical protein
MSRYRAAAIHLGLSALLFVALAYMVLFVWYPGFFFETDGGWEGMRIIAAVDLVVGPLLTLIVFKAGKPGLRFDLTAIGVVQAICLAGGVWIVHDERPIAMVFVDGQFFSLSADDFKEAGVEVPRLDAFPGPEPKWVMVEIPDEPEAQSEIRSRMLRSRVPLRLAVDRYVAFDPTVIAATKPADYQTRPGEASAPVSTAEGAGARFYPFGSRYVYALIGLETETGRVIGVIDPAKPASDVGAAPPLRNASPDAPPA